MSPDPWDSSRGGLLPPKPRHEHLHIFAGDLATLHLLGILVQLPGHPGPKCALWQGVIHIENVIFFKAQLVLHLCQPIIQGPGQATERTGSGGGYRLLEGPPATHFSSWSPGTSLLL